MNRRYFTVIVLAVCLMCGCTQYNGHIGPIFGSWSLVALTEDGLPVELEGETVMSFQNEVVQTIRLLDPPYEMETRYGNFTVTDKTLTLRFQQQPTASGSYIYMTPSWLHFPPGESTIVFDIRKLNGSEMALTLAASGKTMEYRLEKTW